ncbi:hypothetical protein COV06_01465 [Candidatus Uhrbacteria bacterium CG10_big_fil_rev_8_21_14_0_10_50_16]|uniref:Uncharacterized protein n=1 Tax=Candidatus Uhrbacteria bacterium CG10_big_fil_rev_8_21_14_0_10_50_16 TaxID=1975039 RepID=A0A2H0RNG0_9BACT|nr:MAG: hypothetical protein COV06_01465 [Candidatus Uhrbacteria bacterium CG10_big_fil_rev_8_21_14_0_10_50_16]
MLWWLLPLLLLVVSLAVIVWFVVRYYSKLIVLDVSSDPEREKRRKKRALFVQRLERIGGERAQKAGKAASSVTREGKGLIKKLYHHAQAMERHYKRLQKESSGDVAGTLEMRNHLKEEAEELIEKESYAAAEQRLIELLSLDAKNAEVYELLGKVYVDMKQFDQARQTFEYASALAPEDASILTSLGELAMRASETQKAVEYFEAAVDLRSNNPKYLDFLIDASILAGDRKRAQKGLKLLKQVNPENNKIEEFQDRIYSLPL